MARKRRQVVLINQTDSGSAPLGKLPELRARMADFNTGPDGGPDKGTGTEFWYGPGFVVEVPSGHDQVMQAIISVQDDELGLPVLFRMCKSLGFKMQDMESGRIFG
jgi:hypothetical protein